jgi:large subunit ribosomal protein L4
MKIDILSFKNNSLLETVAYENLAVLKEFSFDNLLSQVLPQIKKANVLKFAKTKTVAEVSMSTAKSRPQKGSGRSRQGSGVATSFRGGSKSFGPQAINKLHCNPSWKSRRMSVVALLAKAFQNDRVKVVDVIANETIKTSEFLLSFDKIFNVDPKLPKQNVLIIHPDKIEKNLLLSTRNLFFIDHATPNTLTTNKIKSAHYVLFSKASLNLFIENYLDI